MKKQENTKNILLGTDEEKAFKLLKEIKNEIDNYYSSLLKSFIELQPSQVKNEVSLLLSEISNDDFVPTVINDIKKYLNGEDIGSLIYSLREKIIGEQVFDMVDILCSLNPKSDNFEALEMIILVLKGFNGNISKKDINLSIRLIQKTLKSVNETDQKYYYLTWTLSWLQEKKAINDFITNYENTQ
jgi:hypothetical protein